MVSLLLLASFVIGIVASALGLGGGVFITPMLVLALNLRFSAAVSTSLTAVVATSVVATFYYVRMKLTNFRLGLLLGITGATGALGGAFIASVLTETVTRLLFSFVVFISSYSLWSSPAILGRPESPITPSERPEKAAIRGKYYDPSLESLIEYKASRIPHGLLLGFISGNLSAILGIGGGPMLVPLMRLLMRVPMKAAIATSSFITGIIAVAGACSYCAQGLFDPVLAAPVVIGCLFGSLVGSRLIHLATGRNLRRIFSVLLLLLAVRMLLSAIEILRL